MTCGIYKIVSKKNKKFYIGSSKNIETRFKQHITKLKNGTTPAKITEGFKHHNPDDLL